MQALFLQKLKPHISEARFESYRPVNGSDDDALCRYLWNIALSEALYPVLQILEVGFRNAVHTSIGSMSVSTLGTADWLSAPKSFLFPQEAEIVEAAKTSLLSRRRPLTEAYLVSEVKFGFWTSLLDARYDKVWHKIIKRVFPDMPNTIRTRGEASARMTRVRKMRNAVSHHHSIWHWNDLEQQHADACTLIGWICQQQNQMVQTLDRFPEIYQAGPEPYRTAIKGFISN